MLLPKHIDEAIFSSFNSFLIIPMLHVNQVRDFEYDPETQDSRKQELQKLAHDQETMRTALLQWCYSSYGEVIFRK